MSGGSGLPPTRLSAKRSYRPLCVGLEERTILGIPRKRSYCPHQLRGRGHLARPEDGFAYKVPKTADFICKLPTQLIKNLGIHIRAEERLAVIRNIGKIILYTWQEILFRPAG